MVRIIWMSVCTGAVCKRGETWLTFWTAPLLPPPSSSPPWEVASQGAQSGHQDSQLLPPVRRGEKDDRLSSNWPCHTPTVHNTIICESINFDICLAACRCERPGYEATISFSCMPGWVAWVRGYQLLALKNMVHLMVKNHGFVHKNRT